MSKKILLFALIAGVGIADYFLLRKSNNDLIKDINSILPAAEKTRFDSILKKMNRQELLDTYKLIYASGIEKKKITDTALIARLNVISAKYNIFT
jgi:hypothetical protein